MYCRRMGYLTFRIAKHNPLDKIRTGKIGCSNLGAMGSNVHHQRRVYGSNQ